MSNRYPPIDRAAHGLERKSEFVAQGRAHAKVNITLRVLGRLTRGYHRIESVLVPFSLCDDVVVKLNPATKGVRVTCDLDSALAAHVAACTALDPSIADVVSALEGANNLAARAAVSVLQRSGSSIGVEIALLKRIPFGAGLGGGSADAATTIVLLNALLGDPLSDFELYELAAEIGSDVTALLSGRPVAVAGTGDLIFELRKRETFSDYFTGLRLWVMKPPFGSPTAAAYSSLGFSPSVEQDREAERLSAADVPQTLLKEIHSLGFVVAAPLTGDSRATEQLTLSGPAGISPGLDSPPQGGGLWGCPVNDFKRSVVDANPRFVPFYRKVDELVAEVGGTTVLSGSGSALVLFLPGESYGGVGEQERRAAESTFEARIRAVEPGSFVSSDLSLLTP